ncbi:MAG: LPS export ABC transporter permease LptF [Gammaproteobacteria bacterium]|nr:LPS export ABC transporter permease LptF [Gammaproteobacteria bacterium]
MIIARYLAREVYTVLLATAVVLIIIFLSNQFVHYMHIAAAGDLSSHAVGLLLLLELPVLAAVLLPVSLFLAILMAYGRLYADSEMTVLSACGVSPLRLLLITSAFSAIIMLLVATLTFWVNPIARNYTTRILSGKTSSSIELLQPNRFNSVAGGKWVFYVDTASSDHRSFEKVFAAKQAEGNPNSKKNNLSAVIAKGAYQKVDESSSDLYLVLTNGYQYTGVPGKRDYQIIKYDEYGVNAEQAAEAWQPDKSGTPTIALWQKRADPIMGTELEWRIALPLSAFILALIGAPLSRIKPRYGRYIQLLPGILCYIIYVNLLFLSKAWMKKGVLSLVVGMWWVHGIMLAIALVLILLQLGLKDSLKKLIKKHSV